MSAYLKALLASSTLVLTCPAQAADTLPTTADSVSGFYGKILGQLPAPIAKSIVVAREGNVTKVTFDIVALTEPLKAVGLTFLTKPITLVYTPVADGTLQQTLAEPIDLTVGIDSPGQLGQSGSFVYKGITAEGIFDPSIAFYRSMTLSVAKTAGDIAQRQNGTSATVSTGANAVSLTATDAGNGAVDIKETQTITGFVEHIRVDPAKVQPPQVGPAIDFDVSIPDISVDFAFNGYKAIAVRDFALFLFNNQGDEQIKAKQAEFKQLMHQLLPGLTSMLVTSEAHKMLVQTAYGRGEIGSAALKLGLDTKSPSSSFSIAEQFNGITIDTVFLPDWAKPLVPSDVAFQVDVKGFDLGGVMTVFVGAMDKHDFTDPKPDLTDYGALTEHAFLPTGGAHVDLLPSSIAAPTYKISWQGTVDTIGKKAKAHLDVTATGVDDAIKILSQVRDKGAPETVIGLYGAKALSRPGPNGSLVWAIDVSEEGAMLVNGTAVGPKK